MVLMVETIVVVAGMVVVILPLLLAATDSGFDIPRARGG